jgi:hypothetical protein
VFDCYTTFQSGISSSQDTPSVTLRRCKLKKYILIAAFIFLTLLIDILIGHTTGLTLPKDTPVEVYFSPKGGCTEAIISEIDQAKNGNPRSGLLVHVGTNR